MYFQLLLSFIIQSMGMLLFFQLFHVSLMVHWCMIGPVLHLLLSYHWSAQAVRYCTNKQIDHAIFKSLSFCTEDFPLLDEQNFLPLYFANFFPPFYRMSTLNSGLWHVGRFCEF